MHKILITFVTLSFFCTSCCSISRCPDQKVLFTSNPEDARLIVDGFECGTTPVYVHLNKKQDHDIYIIKDGLLPQEATLKSSHTWKSASNLGTPLVGAAIGTGIGLAVCGAGGYIVPFWIAGTAIGALAGLGLGSLGTVIDISTRADCDLNSNNVHFKLSEN